MMNNMILKNDAKPNSNIKRGFSTFIFFLIFILGVLSNSAAFAERQPGKAIIGGESIGPVKLGQPINAYDSFLGKRISVGRGFYDCPYKKIMILTKNDVITGILTYSPEYSTGEGVRVGAPISKIKQIYGNYLKTDSGALVYSELGLAFNEKKGKISRIMVITAAVDELLGDRIIIPGIRAGSLRLGMNIQTVIQRWGEPTSVEPLKKNNEIITYLYKNKAIKFLVSDNQIKGILVNSYKFRTSAGISINSTLEEVAKAYGKNYKAVNGSLMYGSLGIGFYVNKGKVTEILLTYAVR